MLHDFRIEKIIYAAICAANFFLEVSTVLYVRHCPKLQSCAISSKTNDAILRKCQNPFFSWVLLLLVVRKCSKLSCSAISRKSNEPNLKK